MSPLFFLNLLVLFLPTQLALHFWPSWSLIFGVRVDYLSPTLYFTDILVLGLIVTSFSELLPLLKKHILVLGLIPLFAIFNIAFSSLPLISFLKWVKMFEYLLLVFYINLHPKSVLKSLYRYLPISLGFTLLLSLGQIYYNHTLGGIFYWLGERMFGVNTPGIALFEIFNKNIIRPYATFPHPNALGGFSLVVAVLMFRKKTFAFFISLFLLILSFSQNAWMGAVGCILFFLLSKGRSEIKLLRGIFLGCVLFSLLFPLFTGFPGMSESFEQRVFLNRQAGNILARSPLLGVGLGGFIPNLERRELLQPVHNIYLLIATELGLLGLLLFSVGFANLILRMKNKIFVFCILAILLTSLFDHYWLTMQQNTLLLCFVLGLTISKKNC